MKSLCATLKFCLEGLFLVVSPTYVVAKCLKEGCDANKSDRAEIIKTLNSIYLGFAIVISILLLVYQQCFALTIGELALNSQIPCVCIILWSWFLFSRCNEIFWAFLQDAFDKMHKTESENGLEYKEPKKSNLEYKERIQLALKSYLELVINFAILYLLLPETYWGKGSPESIADALYFSGHNNNSWLW